LRYITIRFDSIRLELKRLKSGRRWYRQTGKRIQNNCTTICRNKDIKFAQVETEAQTATAKQNKKDNEHNKRNEIVAPETVANWTKQPKNESRATRGYTRQGFPTVVCDPKAKSHSQLLLVPLLSALFKCTKKETNQKKNKKITEMK